MRYNQEIYHSLKGLTNCVFSLGCSHNGQNLYAARAGGGKRGTLIVTAGIHARERYGAQIVIEQLRHTLKNPCGFTVYFIPLLNPDGADICETGVEGFKEHTPVPCPDYALYKANARGVDLNTNFDANFGQGEQNLDYPCYENYTGARPFSEKETAALRDFTLWAKPCCTLSYHAMGGEVYWEYFQEGASKERDGELAQFISKYTGYKKVDGHLNSAGGYKDWCIQKLRIPSFTIELISEPLTHPLRKNDFEADIPKNSGLIGQLCKQIMKYQ